MRFSGAKACQIWQLEQVPSWLALLVQSTNTDAEYGGLSRAPSSRTRYQAQELAAEPLRVREALKLKRLKFKCLSRLKGSLQSR